MNPARRALEIFEHACALEHAERAAWIERSCAGDDELLAAVTAMIAADDDGGFLELGQARRPAPHREPPG